MASISAIQSMDYRSATKLRKAGVRTTDSLLKAASTRTGRRRLAKETGLPESDILGWVNRADLARISGVGSEYADLLECAGVDTVPELAQRSAKSLHAKIISVNKQKKLVRNPPSLKHVEDWVKQAKSLPRAITY